MEAKEQIRDRLDIAEIVGESVALTPAGRGRFKGLCPFHGEKTPSFHVLADKGFYYCFGCSAKGDIFDFLMQTQGMDFNEALTVLGRRADVEVKPMTQRDHKKRDLYDVNTLTQSYFVQNLSGPAMDYLLGRGLTEKSIESFGLGFAPDEWDGLLKYAVSKGTDQDDLSRAGLLSESQNGKIFDRFRNRIMFPIKDTLGRIVGFSGRVLDDSLPKYMNTPETDVFKKGEILYGLDVAKPAIREQLSCIVVEGYMDVIALHQTGFMTAVAALGATLTKEQAEQLSRLDVEKLYLAFDADAAGQRAILSGLEQSVGRQFMVKAVQIPEGKDPADTVLSGQLDAFRNALFEGLSEVEFRFESVLQKHDKSTSEGKRAILNELLPALKPRALFDPVAAELRRLTIEALRLEPVGFDQWLQSKKSNRIDETQLRGIEKTSAADASSHIAIMELEMIALLMLEPSKLEERLEEVEDALPSNDRHSFIKEFCELCRQVDYKEQSILHHYRNKNEGKLLFERLVSSDLDDDDTRIDIEVQLQKSLSRLRVLQLEEEVDEQREQLRLRQSVIATELTKPDLPTDQLQGYYAELKEIQVKLNAREAEKRMWIPDSKFSKKK